MPLEPAANRAVMADAPELPWLVEPIRRLAGSDFEALLLSGSHATGEAVWATVDGARVSLSDLDLFLVLRTESGRRDTLERSREIRRTIEQDGRSRGYVAPVEIAFLTPERLAALPARPGTIELRRHGRTLSGNPAVLGRAPAFTARDVPAEERRLLIENRGFELLLAHPALVAHAALARLRARHAVLKTALDLALAAALERGELPDGARERVEWARRNASEVCGAALDSAWDRALAWRETGAIPDDAPEATWNGVARAWCAAWRAAAGGRAAGVSSTFDPHASAALALAAARRAPLRRRLRAALFPDSPATAGPATGRLRHALAGTPQHRVNAAAALLLSAAVRDGGAPALGGHDRRALARLGFGASGDWTDAARAVTRAWDRWVLDGRRVAAS